MMLRVTWLFVLMMTMIHSQCMAYQNPIAVPSEWPTAGQPDPRVTRFLGHYYLYATKEGLTTDKLRAWRSKDLVHWSVINSDLTPDDTWEHAWAPDVFYHTDGLFYMYHSGPEGSPSVTRHRLLTSSFPWGPFTLVDSDFNATNNIDGSVFRDDDGQLYFIYADGNNPLERGIHIRTMSSPLAADGTPTYLANCIVDAVAPGHPLEKWTEGPQIIKVNGEYYLSYCGNSWNEASYQSHVARGSSLATLAPQANNPIISNLSGNYTGTGHNDVILGPDLMTHYTVYHGLDETGSKPYLYRQLFLDRVDFDGSGNMLVDGGSGPSLATRDDPASPHFEDYFDRSVLNPASSILWEQYGTGNWGLWHDPAFWGLMWGDNRGDGTAWSYQYAATATGSDYVVEFNTKLRGLGSTSAYPKYGVTVSFDPVANSGLAVFFDQPNSLLALYAWENGLPLGPGWSNAPLPAGFNYDYWHTLRIEKNGSQFKIFVDDMLKATRDDGVDLGGGYCGHLLEDAWAEFGYMAYSMPGDVLPNPPSNPTILAVSTDSITWGWQDNSSDEDGFPLYLEIGDTASVPNVYTEAINAESWQSTSLSPNTEYSFQASALKHSAGESGRSDLLTTWTQALTPSALELGTTTAHTIAFELAPGDGNPALTEYAIRITPDGANAQWLSEFGILVEAPVYLTRSAWSSVLMRGLTEGTQYTCEALARNGAGVTTDLGPSVDVQTQPGEPNRVSRWQIFH